MTLQNGFVKQIHNVIYAISATNNLISISTISTRDEGKFYKLKLCGERYIVSF